MVAWQFFNPPPPAVRPVLTDALQGNLQAGERDFKAWVRAYDKDDAARFSLAVIQLAKALEHITQAFYRYGFRPDRDFGFFSPLFQTPVPTNPNPQTIKYSDLNKLFQDFNNDLEEIRKTLRPIQNTDWKVPIALGQAQLDFNGDGKYQEDEKLWRVFSALTGIRVTPEEAKNFTIAFDYGDALWLQAYTHVLSGMMDFLLAYDRQELFEKTAHLFFARPETPHQFLAGGLRRDDQFLDWLAAIHLFRFELVDAPKVNSACGHLVRTIQLSRASWSAILQEQDNDREWLPNPQQDSIFPEVRVEQEMITSWINTTQEIEAIFNGQKLLPFWRNDPRGVNLRRVCIQPSRFDLISWVQGTAATPYLENGTFTDDQVWNGLNKTFRGNLLPFILWFN